jgi:hypothetical protein
VCHSEGAPSSMRASLLSGGRDQDSGESGPTRSRGGAKLLIPQEKSKSILSDSLYFEYLHFHIYLCYLDELSLCLVDCTLQPSC